MTSIRVFNGSDSSEASEQVLQKIVRFVLGLKGRSIKGVESAKGELITTNK